MGYFVGKILHFCINRPLKSNSKNFLRNLIFSYDFRLAFLLLIGRDLIKLFQAVFH